MLKVKIEKISPSAQIPTRESKYAAGYDMYADTSASIPPGECIKVPTGIAMEVPEDYFGGIFARSGLSTKEGLRPANCVGVIDSDYRGEILVPLRNDSRDFKYIEKGQRIAQIILIPRLDFEFDVVDKLNKTERGAGGFGSTGSK